jgi:hypothetical protein
MEKQLRGTRGGFARIALVGLAGTTALACSGLNGPLYFAGPTFEAAGGDDPLPTSGLTLRFRNPTDLERMQLDDMRTQRGYDADIPWVPRGKVHIEVSYKITNISDQSASFTLMVDGASEFAKYDTQMVATALQQGNDPPTFLPLIPVVPPKDELPPGGSYSGIVREDDFTEGEMDLDALVRWNDANTASPTFAGVLINRSEVKPYIGMGMVPDYGLDPNTNQLAIMHPGLLVVPAMIEIDLRLKTDVAMRCEYYVRVRDDDDRLLHNDGDTRFIPAPMLFQAPAAM